MVLWLVLCCYDVIGFVVVGYLCWCYYDYCRCVYCWLVLGKCLLFCCGYGVGFVCWGWSLCCWGVILFWRWMNVIVFVVVSLFGGLFFGVLLRLWFWVEVGKWLVWGLRFWVGLLLCVGFWFSCFVLFCCYRLGLLDNGCLGLLLGVWGRCCCGCRVWLDWVGLCLVWWLFLDLWVVVG